MALTLVAGQVGVDASDGKVGRAVIHALLLERGQAAQVHGPAQQENVGHVGGWSPTAGDARASQWQREAPPPRGNRICCAAAVQCREGSCVSGARQAGSRSGRGSDFVRNNARNRVGGGVGATQGRPHASPIAPVSAVAATGRRWRALHGVRPSRDNFDRPWPTHQVANMRPARGTASLDILRVAWRSARGRRRTCAPPKPADADRCSRRVGRAA